MPASPDQAEVQGSTSGDFDAIVIGAGRRHPDASPLEAMFLTGVPPAVILTAEHDVLGDDGELHAMVWIQAGVAVEHRRFTGQIHGFLGRIDLPGSADGFSYIAGGVDRCLERERGALT